MRKFKMFIIGLMLVFSVSCYADKTVSTTILFPDGISLIFDEAEFDKNRNKVTDCGDGFICLIDNQPLWGADGKIPETKLQKAQLRIKGVSIALDTSGMYDPMVSKERKGHYQLIHYYGDTWKVRGRFSDGAGAYYAEWLVTKNGSIRIMLGDTELLYDAFDNIFGKQ